MAIALSFGALIGILGLFDMMAIGQVQPIVNIIYTFFNIFLIVILRKNKQWYRRVAWAQVVSSLIVFAVALATVVHDEFRIAWFYIALYLTYMLLGERSGNFLTLVSIIVIIVMHYYLELQLSNTAIQTAIFSLIVFGLLSRVYNMQIKNYEAELEDKNYDLAAVIKNLDFALEDAQAASKAKSLFLANMSHEIRTPMNGMLSLVQVLRTTQLDEKQRDYLQSIDRAGVILMSLIDDLLDLSKIESGKLEVNETTFKLWNFIDDILLQVEYLFEEKDVHFNVDVYDELPAYLITDEVRLKQVVINLINNAAKFTSHGEVNLVMKGDKDGSGNFNLHIEVNDTGIGIPEDMIDSIFEPFQQLSPTRIYNKGVGLGLPICKKIITVLGGNIKVKSTPDKGSRFILDFSFPIAEVTEADDQKQTTNIILKPLRILLVEDDQISRLAVKTWLSDKGHEMIIAENGQQAVNYLHQDDVHVDVILMDVHMPEMDGIQATKIIKEENLSQAPIIGMTASVMNDERKSYLKAGMDVLVEKPVNFENLMIIVKEKLN
ncbi:MAG: ATP-binding protein [Gammaproteobacteria bacterium]|nr:ATP-binding protein [Gammaproteobacteria bacterium]MCW8986715.1 ATP-binding protein [Gammaproteobacteria bacterium]